jgi:hypothetical protein
MFKTAVYKILRVQYLLFIFLCVILSPVHAQQGKGHAVQANIIYHFSKYINWPDEMKSGDFVIGVIGEPHLIEALQKAVANKTVGDQPIVISSFSTGATSYSCHILFVSDEESDYLKKIVAATAGHPVLLVSETEGAAHKGSCINFVIIDDRLRLEINKTNIEKRDLNIATELLQLGKVIK